MSKKYKIIDIGPLDSFHADKEELIGSEISEHDLDGPWFDDGSVGAKLSNGINMEAGGAITSFLQIWVEEIKGGTPDAKE